MKLNCYNIQIQEDWFDLFLLFKHPADTIFINLVVKWLNYAVIDCIFNVCISHWASTMLHNIQLDCR